MALCLLLSIGGLTKQEYPIIETHDFLTNLQVDYLLISILTVICHSTIENLDPNLDPKSGSKAGSGSEIQIQKKANL